MIFLKNVQFFGSYQKSVQFFDSYVFKNLILRVMFFKKVDSLSHFFDKKIWVVWKKVLILRVFLVWKQEQFFDSAFRKKVQSFEFFLKVAFFESIKKRCSILWVVLKNIFESYLKDGSILWVILKKKFNSLSHFVIGFNFLSHTQKESSILWDIFPQRIN